MPSHHRKLARACSSLVVTALLASGEAWAEPSKLPPEIGWNYGEQELPRTTALNGATRAVGADLQGLYSNPANMAASRVYHLGAGAQIWPEARRQSYGAAAVDFTHAFAGGLSGTYSVIDSDGLKRKATDIKAGVAFAVSEKLLFGATGKYLKLRQDGLGPFGTSLASGGLSGEPIVDGFSFDAGVTVKPTQMFSLALVGGNLTNPGDGFRPTTVGGGLGVAGREFSLEADMVADFTSFEETKIRAMGGGEYLAADKFPLRAGYRYDQGQNSHSVSGGVGYIDTQFALEVSLRRIVSGPGATAVVFGFQYFLDSVGGGSGGYYDIQ